jgi:HlyD family secretion protein
MRRRHAVPLALLVLALLAAGFAWTRLTAGPVGPTATVARGDFRRTIEATGTLEAAVYVEIGTPSVRDFWQYNLTWIIPDGSRVKEGDVVARFDAQQIDDRLRENRAELETATHEKEKEQRDLDISLRQLQLDVVQAEGDVEKVTVESSVPEELVPARELAQTRLREKLARHKVEFLKQKIDFQKQLVKAKLDLLEVKRTRAEQKIAYYEEARRRFDVKAPIAGVVIPIPKRNGDRWEVGEGVWMMAKILRVADEKTLRVEGHVLEVDAARVRVGQAAEVTMDALPGRVYRTRVGEVGRIVRERSVQDPSKVFDAFLPLEEIDRAVMRPGMSIRAEIETDILPGRLILPLAAVRGSIGGPYVEVIRRGGGIERRSVVLGPRSRDRVVVESGVEAGEKVALEPAGEKA